ncbi:MAG: acyl carrier protein [Candidatus Marinimicrobia bacterium]|nr:acyl carrier protein [Candidatus Neomarinimicrobiota bacterium]
MSDTKDKVVNIIVEKLAVDIEKITSEADFVSDLGADSLDQVELIMQLEEEFNIEISDEDAESLNNLDKVLSFLEKKQNK